MFLSLILFNSHSESLAKEALQGFGDFTIERQVIRTVKYAGDMVLLAKEVTVQQSMIDRGVEVGRCCGMEKNVEKLT
jgi:hypothetical protein